MNIDEGKLKLAEIQPPLAAKKPRALPHVWARFHALKINEVFFVGADRAIKVNGFGFRRYARPACFVNDWGKQSRFEFIALWKRVKTDVLVRDARPGGKFSGVVAHFDPRTVKFFPKVDFSRDMDLERPPGAQSIQQTGPSA